MALLSMNPFELTLFCQIRSVAYNYIYLCICMMISLIWFYNSDFSSKMSHKVLS